MRGLFGILRSIAALGAITVAIDVVVRNFAQLMAARQAFRELNAKRDPVGATGPQPAMTAERRYTGAAREKVIEDINKQREHAARLRREIQDIESRLLVAESVPGAGRASLFTAGLKAQADLKRVQLREAEEVIKLDLKTFKTREQIQSEYLRGMNERFKTVDGGEGKADKEAEKAAREAQRLYEENLRNAMRLQDVGLRTLQLEELTTLERERQQLVNRDADRIEFAILDLKQKQFGLDIRQTHLNEVNERLEDLRVQGLRQGLDVSKTAEEISKNKIEYLELQLEAEKNITDQLELQRQIIEATGLTREMRQAGRRAAIGVFDYGQAGAANFAGGEQIYQPQEFMTPEAQRFQEMRQQLEEMISLQNQVQAGAMQMGEAFSSAFIETITGSKSAKQALADLMASIGKHFLDMAQQIITQQIAMILYGTIMKALGVGLSGGGAAPNYSGVFSSGQAGFNPSVFTGPSLLPAANGAAFAQNGIQPFAMGGIVTKPTFFKYAKGGEMQNGLMGEAGAEAIMPLKRGADGKLGVAARLDGAMKRYRSTPGSAAAAAEGDSASLAAAGAATMEPIDVRYSVERINNVDYVTADQFQRGMAQAAQQGAIQGERRAMRSLKNSAATRRGVGI
jgi:phage-related minor tail protein